MARFPGIRWMRLKPDVLPALRRPPRQLALDDPQPRNGQGSVGGRLLLWPVPAPLSRRPRSASWSTLAAARRAGHGARASGLNAIEDPLVKRILRAYDASCDLWNDVLCRHAFESDHEARRAAALAADKRAPRAPEDPRRGWSPPAGKFNAVVNPIGRLAIRGALFYQGGEQPVRPVDPVRAHVPRCHRLLPRCLRGLRTAFWDHHAARLGPARAPGRAGRGRRRLCDRS